MLQSIAGARVDAPRHTGNAPVHQLSLRFEKGQLRISRQDPPWKVVRAFPQENGTALVHLHNVSGGVLAGDQLAIDIDIAAGAAAQITTTGATRLYRHREGRADSRQYVNIAIGEDSVLEYLPDPIIPYAGARHAQHTKISLAPRAALFWWEVLAPGRQAHGEQFAFERLAIETCVASGARPLLLERVVLEPGQRALSTTARMQRYSWTASLSICHAGREPEFWRGLEKQLTEMAKQRTRNHEMIWGASTLVTDGVVVRGLSTSGRHIQPALTDFWRVARRAVTGREAVLPRKVY